MRNSKEGLVMANSDPVLEPFTLGRPFGVIEVPPDKPGDPSTRPFGLRFAVTPPPSATAVIEPTSLSYDHDRQIAVVYDGGAVVPVMKHTSNQTKTSTNSDDRTPPDTDSDVGGD
jgi:putative ATP-grasp target RiPP